MRQPKADANYTIYLSFFAEGEAGNKTPLTEPFYLGSAILTGAAEPVGGGEEVPQAEGELVWAAWENKDINTLGDDNTGSTFAVSEDVLSPAGNPTLQVTPSGTSEETKLASQSRAQTSPTGWHTVRSHWRSIFRKATR
jgi:hypothetical protein